MTLTLRKGDKVICKADKYTHGREIPEGYQIKTPQKNLEYTVRAYLQTPFGDAILLEEIRNPTYQQDGQTVEPGFGTNRFDKA